MISNQSKKIWNWLDSNPTNSWLSENLSPLISTVVDVITYIMLMSYFVQLLPRLSQLQKFWRTVDMPLRRVRIVCLLFVKCHLFQCCIMKWMCIIYINDVWKNTAEIMTSTVDMKDESRGRPIQKAKVN